MKKSFSIKRKKYKYFCDICDSKVKKDKFDDHECVECKRDICDSCRGYFTYGVTYDYIAGSLCKSCHEISKPIEKKLEKMWDKYNNEQEELRKRCHKACIAAIKPAKSS